MASQTQPVTTTTGSEPEIILYDLASTKNLCFSPGGARIRLMLNYKRIPYKTVFIEFPDIAPTLKAFGIIPPESGLYTVPAIHHLASDKYIMDSASIAQFLESTYPSPSVPLTSELGDEILRKARSVAGKVMQTSVLPREMFILSPRSQEYFRRTREAALGHPLEQLLQGDKESQIWEDMDAGFRALGQLLLTNHDKGPFILGEKPSYADFFIAGSLKTTRVVEESVFQRYSKYPGYHEIYQACLPFMDKWD
ncbi:hypothetical protein BCR39DRAFT_557491 [Naematelia encephala]|uniref:Uncharacterized protein n=1 Tax=Naematelia encephala TaxID=71784 RepID=A0A1Y2BCE0_9TREE|nr:hypothetical protein BCR39DRAFT_557491 [Naematelia encephala]